MNRRRLLQALAATLASAALPTVAGPPARHLRAAAIQMQPRLGDVAHNLDQADRLIEEAVHRGADWVLLPEMFSSAAGFHEDTLRKAPPRLARLLGVPVVHASHAGPFHGFDSPELPDVAYDSAYLGESMICDAQGRVLARRAGPEGAGVVIADLLVPTSPPPVEPIPHRFWLPKQIPEELKDAWIRWLPRGQDYYDTVTRPYLASGEIDEYVPPYMRD